MPRLRRVSAKTFSSIFPCLRSSICCSKMSISRPNSAGSLPSRAFFQFATFCTVISFPILKPTKPIYSVGNSTKKICPERLDIIHQRRSFRLTKICERRFLQNLFHGFDPSCPSFDQPLSHGRQAASLCARSQLDPHNRPFQYLQHFSDRDALRWPSQYISPGRPA